MRRLILPFLALLTAGGATYGARSWLAVPREVVATASAPAPKPLVQAVLVAAKDLAPGEFLQADGARWQEWPDVAVPDSYLVRGKAQESDLVGAVPRRPIAAGEPLSAASVVKPGDRGFLAAVLDPGLRAISVPVDEASSNAGLVFPGDRVDLIVTQTLDLAGQSAGQRRVSETVLADVRVIAMGRSLKAEGGDGAAPAAQARTATLEATPADAEKVALAAELGKLSLSLRSLAAADGAGDGGRVPPSPTWDLEVSPALRPENQPRSTLAVVRGGKLETVAVRRGAGP